MRQIGKLTDEESAKRLVAFLLTKGIKSLADVHDGHWEIWIKEEDDVDSSRAIFDDFIAHPDNKKYADAVVKAQMIAEEELQRQLKNRDNVVDVRGRWAKPHNRRKPLVMTLMIISVAVFVLTNGWEFDGGREGEKTVVMKSLLFVDPDEVGAAIDDYVNNRAKTSESSPVELRNQAIDSLEVKLTNIKEGQLWRLFTSIFIHFGIIHILFNMVWLNILGGQVESVYGTTRFGFFVLGSAIFTVTLQSLMPMAWGGTPAVTICGGMSGVNYAIAGFVWMKMIFDPSKGLFLSPVNQFILIVWMLMGFFNESLSMANWAHGGGFVFGLVVGYVPSRFKNNKSV